MLRAAKKQQFAVPEHYYSFQSAAAHMSKTSLWNKNPRRWAASCAATMDGHGPQASTQQDFGSCENGLPTLRASPSVYLVAHRNRSIERELQVPGGRWQAPGSSPSTRPILLEDDTTNEEAVPGWGGSEEGGEETNNAIEKHRRGRRGRRRRRHRHHHHHERHQQCRRVAATHRCSN